ncbi:MAG: HAMP domain-containing sensor histidine kinase [Pseudomonadota bacterium]|nr:HAMP domain-containing sensor histidine kinase [Pseudomonadota bacterium]
MKSSPDTHLSTALMSSALAHDIKNQLQAWIGQSAQVLAEVSAADRPKVQALITQTQRIHQTTLQWMALSQLDQVGRYPSDDAWPTATINAVREASTTAYPDVEWQLEVDELSQGYYHEGLVQMALSNLCNNAMQLGASRLTIRVEETADGALQWQCLDNGPGFPQTILAAYSCEGTSFDDTSGEGVTVRALSEREGGSGFGLAFVCAVLAHHGCADSLQLSNHDDGARVVWCLPG